MTAGRPWLRGVVAQGWFVPATAGLIGALAMTLSLGPAQVDPRNYEWLMHHDYGLHFLGWHLYRGGPWTWPIGETPLLIWPIGSSIGLTDSIPIAAFFFKPLDPLLPPVFQFIGLWMVLCFALQGVFGALLMQLATPRPTLQLLGAVVFILSPPLVFRLVHAALMAHWLLLAALWLSLKDDADVPSRKLAAAWAGLSAVAAATQPYILLMVLVLMLAAHGRQLLAAPSRLWRIGLHAAVSAGAAGLALWQSGSLMIGADDGLEVGGFGGWSTNLLSFVMPTEGRTLLAPGPIAYASPGQYEGYAYLGAGTVLLGGVVLVSRLASLRSLGRPQRILRHLPLALALLFLAAMAVGPIVTLGSRTLFRYDVDWWGPLTIFRTQGRMIWPAYYATMAAILFATCRFTHRRALVLLASALVVQTVDLAGMVGYIRDASIWGFYSPLRSSFWDIVPRHYERLVLVPTNLCPDRGSLNYLPFSVLAGRDGLAINAGATARYDVRKAQAYCAALGREFLEGMDAAGSLYIVRPDLLERSGAAARPGSRCTMVDGFGVCFAADSYARWRDEIDVPRSRLPETAEFVRFYDALDETYRTVLARPVRDAPAATDVRVEGLVRYLSYRMEGCTHGEAEQKALASLAAPAPDAFCAALAAQPELPPADQTYTFSRTLDAALRERGESAAAATHVDLEGEAVWLQVYARERARGIRELDARAAVIEAVRAAGQ